MVENDFGVVNYPFLSVFAGLKDPCVMETAQGHVILQNSINQSGLMDQFNPTQRRKKALVKNKNRSLLVDAPLFSRG